MNRFLLAEYETVRAKKERDEVLSPSRPESLPATATFS